MPLNAKLVVVGGDVKTAEIKLRLPSTVGRGRGTTIMLPHPLVSRQHCELFEVNGQLMVRDLGSLNGTFVNNQRVTESPLPPGELLTIGTVTFRAMYESQPESQPPPGAGPQMKAGRRNETDSAGLPATVQQPAPAGDDEPFSFEPVDPVDDVAAPLPAGAMHGTGRMEATLEDPPAGVKTTSAASAKTKPAPAKPPMPVAKPLTPSPAATNEPAKTPAPSKPAAPEKGEATVNVSKWQDDAEDADEVKTDDDDDLGDFLKSLKK
jgi:predicted component of type VI protein secretion system